MPNSQSDNSTITKLVEVDADLATQEFECLTQIQSIGERRRSLKTVINMFAPGDTTTTPIATSAQLEAVAVQQKESTPPIQPPVVQDLAASALNVESVNTTTDTPTAPTPQKQKVKKNPAPTSNEQSKKSALLRSKIQLPILGSSMSKTNLAPLR